MEISRRYFLEGLGGAALIAGSIPSALASGGDPSRIPIGLELYTVDNAMKEDFEGTLQRVAEIGYRDVEFPWYHGRSASEVSASLKAAGLRCQSGLFILDGPEFDSPTTIDFAHSLGLKYLGCVMMPLPDAPNIPQAVARLTVDDFRRFAEWLNKLGEKTREAGIQLTFHNHDYEFTKFGNVVGYDELLRLTDPKLVQMELDVGWVVWAGFDPVEYLRQYPGRISLLHVRDLKQGTPYTPLVMQSAEIGSGIIDWQKLFTAARDSGVKMGYVEQDPSTVSASLKSAKISFEYLDELVY